MVTYMHFRGLPYWALLLGLVYGVGGGAATTWGVLGGSVAPLPMAPSTQYYGASGLMKSADAPAPSAPAEESQAFSSFIAAHYSGSPDFSWRLFDTIRDRTHVHNLYR